MITSVTKKNWVETHIVKHPPTQSRKMFAITRCGQMAHTAQTITEEHESEEDIHNLCEECEGQ